MGVLLEKQTIRQVLLCLVDGGRLAALWIAIATGTGDSGEHCISAT
jgi:hypothetical protein